MPLSGSSAGELTSNNRSILCRRLRGEEGGIRRVVGAVEGDGEGVGVSETTGVSDLIVDVDDLGFTSGEAVVGVVGWIKLPGTIRVDGQTSNACRIDRSGPVMVAEDWDRRFGIEEPSAAFLSMSVDVS